MMSLGDEKSAEAEKCIEKAETAFYKGDLDKAERLLLKAERIHPTLLAKQILDNVQAKRRRENGEDETSEPPVSTQHDNYFRDELDIRKAETCIIIAKLAMAKGDFDKAKRFIIKSDRLHRTDEIKQLLNDLEAMKIKFNGTTYNGTGNYASESDAEACILLAQEELVAGNYARAEKMVLKAERLFPSARAKGLLKQIEEAKARGVPEDKPREKESKTVKQPQKCLPKPKRQGPSEKHLNAIKQVQEAKNDYEMFGLDKDANIRVNAINKAYRRLAASLHPDKNKAPGAKEAFMAMGDAAERIKINKK